MSSMRIRAPSARPWRCGVAEGGFVQVRRQSRHEDCGPQPGRVETGCADAPEPQGRKVPLEGGLREVTAADRIDGRSGERLKLAILLLVHVVDVVVAEPAEVEIREGLFA